MIICNVVACDQVSYNMQISWKLQHVTTGPDAGATTLHHPRKRPDRLSSYRLSVSFTIRTPVKSFNICNTVVSFPFTIRANGRIGYQIISCRFPLSLYAQTVGSVQFLITNWMVSCQTTPNRCMRFGDDHMGCHLDQHLPRSR